MDGYFRISDGIRTAAGITNKKIVRGTIARIYTGTPGGIKRDPIHRQAGDAILNSPRRKSLWAARARNPFQLESNNVININGEDLQRQKSTRK